MAGAAAAENNTHYGIVDWARRTHYAQQIINNLMSRYIRAYTVHMHLRTCSFHASRIQYADGFYVRNSHSSIDVCTLCFWGRQTRLASDHRRDFSISQHSSDDGLNIERNSNSVENFCQTSNKTRMRPQAVSSTFFFFLTNAKNMNTPLPYSRFILLVACDSRRINLFKKKKIIFRHRHRLRSRMIVYKARKCFDAGNTCQISDEGHLKRGAWMT